MSETGAGRPAPSPLGLRIVAAAVALYGLFWLALAARFIVPVFAFKHAGGTMPATGLVGSAFLTVSSPIATGVCALVAAVGVWRGAIWAGFVMALCALLSAWLFLESLWVVGLVAADSHRPWLLLGALVFMAAVTAALVLATRWVWRRTRPA